MSLYRDFNIEWIGEGPGADWQATHKDFDGPEDNRCWHAGTAGELIDLVDEYHEEQTGEVDEAAAAEALAHARQWADHQRAYSKPSNYYGRLT